MELKYEFKTTPYKHQRNVLEGSWNEINWAYLMEMGTGKSKVCIDNAAVLFLRNEIDTFVVVAPKGVYRNWANLEIPAHMPDGINRTVAVWKSGANKADRQLLNDLLKPSEALRVLVMNVEALSTPKGRKYLTALLRASKALLAVDESTAIKSPKAGRTKALIKIGQLAKYRRILTGFPVTQSPMDLWAQCRFLNKELLGDCGDNFFQFSSRITKDECLDLPSKIYTQRNISLTDDQDRIYGELKEFALAHIDDEEFMTANNVMTQLLRMQQVLSGHVKSDAGELIEVKDNRLNELLDCLEEIEGKAIIWSRFRYDVKRITEALTKAHGPGSTVSYFGDTTDEERSSAIEQFQNGTARFFVGNPQTGGYGITLTAANTVIYFANSFDLAVRMQSEDRAHRIGQTDHVTYIDFISEKTIDEKIVKALRNKMDIASTVLGEELKEWLR